MSNDNFRNKNILSDLLISVGQDLRNAFERSINIKHHGERGRIREERVLSFLIERLPNTYSIGTGHVVDSFGGISQQIDGVIFHAASTPILYTESNEDSYQPQLFFIEGVSSVISVKSELNKAELSNAFENIMSIKKLKRRYMGNMDLIAGDKTLPPHTPPLGIVFAYDSSLPKQMVQTVRSLYLEAGPKTWEFLPEVIFVLDKVFILTPSYVLTRFDSRKEKVSHPMIIGFLDSQSSPLITRFYSSVFTESIATPIWKLPIDAYGMGGQTENPVIFSAAVPSFDEILEGDMQTIIEKNGTEISE
jgi:hypothetical protein